jgi:hypothetical protein
MEWNLALLAKILVVVVLLFFFRPIERFFKSLVDAHAGHFQPYRVSIKPNWYQLLLDFGLIKDLDEWQRIASSLEVVPPSDYNVLRDGITFTVLKPSLIYRNDRKEFATHVKFVEFLAEVSLLHPDGWEQHPSISVDFAAYAKEMPREGAYGISLTSTNSVGEQMRDYDGRVVAALLPWAEFRFYREDPGEFELRRWSKLSAVRDKRRKEFGWELEREPESRDEPSLIQHKYFALRHQRI